MIFNWILLSDNISFGVFCYILGLGSNVLISRNNELEVMYYYVQGYFSCLLCFRFIVFIEVQSEVYINILVKFQF